MRAALLLLPVLAGWMILAAPAQTPAPPKPAQATTPTPDGNGLYKIGNGVSAPRLLHQPEFDFANEASNMHLSGGCSFTLVIAADGTVRSVKVLRSISHDWPDTLRSTGLSLDEVAIHEVQQYRFEPARLEGRPVSVAMNMNFDWSAF